MRIVRAVGVNACTVRLGSTNFERIREASPILFRTIDAQSERLRIRRQTVGRPEAGPAWNDLALAPPGAHKRLGGFLQAAFDVAHHLVTNVCVSDLASMVRNSIGAVPGNSPIINSTGEKVGLGDGLHSTVGVRRKEVRSREAPNQR